MVALLRLGPTGHDIAPSERADRSNLQGSLVPRPPPARTCARDSALAPPAQFLTRPRACNGNVGPGENARGRAARPGSRPETFPGIIALYSELILFRRRGGGERGGEGGWGRRRSGWIARILGFEETTEGHWANKAIVPSLLRSRRCFPRPVVFNADSTFWKFKR